MIYFKTSTKHGNWVLALGVFGFGILGCSESTNRQKEIQEPFAEKVIYGTDDRLDLFQIGSAEWQARASATVALMQKSKLTEVANGFQIQTSHYGNSQNLCKSEPFFDQVTAAFCSGSLITPNIIMTAGHCIRTQSSCANTRFVFNFAYKSMTYDPKFVVAEDVYSCQKLIHSELNSKTDSDFALVLLDRPVLGRSPLPIRQTGRINDSQSLVVIGHPSGLATKFAAGASVRSNTSDAYFVANLDTYGGNSGSAVFNEQTGVVEGILVRGETDFKFKNGCYVSNVCDVDGCRGEDVTRVSEVLSYVNASDLAQEIPSSSVESERLHQ
jgi:hypothetical protein